MGSISCSAAPSRPFSMARDDRSTPHTAHFPVVWPADADPSLHWTLDDEEPAPFLSPSDGWARHGVIHAHAYWHGPVADIRRLRLNSYAYSARVIRSDTPAESAARAVRATEDLETLVDSIEARWEDNWAPRIRSALHDFEDFDPGFASDGELAEEIGQAHLPGHELWEVHFELVFGCGYIRRQFDTYCAEVFGADTDLGTATLTAGDHNMSVASGERLLTLVEFVHDRTALETLVLKETWRDMAVRLDQVSGGPEFRTRLAAFIADFGRKLTDGLAGPTWEESPDLVLANLRALLRLGGDFGRGRREGVIADKEHRLARARKILAALPRALGEEFERLYQSASVATRLMEDHNHYIDQQSAYFHRRLLVEAARRLVRQKRLGSVTDVSFLTESELAQALVDPDVAPSMLAAARAHDASMWRQRKPPKELGGPEPSLPPHPLFGPPKAPFSPPKLEEAPGTLIGLGASRGVVVARVRIVRELAGASALVPGEILVTTVTSPSWATWYPILGGLVTETGGVLTHAAVVAREYGIPAVVAVPSATTALHDGDLVELDGQAGTVRRVQDP